MADESAITRRQRLAIESMAEDERLRSALTDDEARVLLGWANGQVEAAARSATAASKGGAGKSTQTRFDADVRRIRAVTSDINDLVGERAGLNENELAQRVANLIASWEGKAPAAVSLDKGAVAYLKSSPDNQAFIRRLTEMLGARAGDKPVGSGRRPPWLLLAVAGGLLLLCLLAAGGVLLARGRIAARPTTTAIVIATYPPAQVAESTAAPAGPGPATAVATVDARASQAQATATPGNEAPPYQVYFTAPVYPDKVANHAGSLDEKLAAFIDKAGKSVDMAIYQLDLPNVTQALLDAKKRGAVVRVVTDIDILNDPKENPSFKQLQRAGITVVGGNPNAIMHDKFVVVDGEAVWTGSWNFTTNDTYRYNNNGIELRSPELARNYTVTFEKMWRNKKFGSQRAAGGTQSHVTVGGTAVENYFAPEDGVSEKIAARLNAASQSIDFMAFSFTDNTIGNAILTRAKKGVKVRGVFETTGSETQYSEYSMMKKAGLDVWQDGNPYLMHHKVFIVDGKTVIFGSFNFSESADTENDENLLIVDDPVLAGRFQDEFGRVYAQAKNPPAKKK